MWYTSPAKHLGFVTQGGVGTIVPFWLSGCWDLWSLLWAQRGLYSTLVTPERPVMVNLDWQPHGIGNHHGNKQLGLSVFLDPINWGEKTDPVCEWMHHDALPSWVEHSLQLSASWPAGLCSDQLFQAPAEVAPCHDALRPWTVSPINLSFRFFFQMLSHSSETRTNTRSRLQTQMTTSTKCIVLSHSREVKRLRSQTITDPGPPLCAL